MKTSRRIQRLRGAYTRWTRHWTAALRVLSVCFDILTVLASFVCMVALALFAGYDSSVISYAHILPWLRICRGMFAFNILFNLLLRPSETLKGSRPLRWIVDCALLLTLLDVVSSSRLAMVIILGTYSGVYVSYSLLRSLGKHTNPSLILAASFVAVIAAGSAILLLPRCTVNGISLIDSIFVSTSAVCICGLTTVDISATFTPLGLIVISVMMQVGALGVMTFTSFFALFFSGSTSIYSQLIVKDMFYSKTINSLLPSLLYTLGFTLVIEATGAAAIYWSVIGTIPGYSNADYLVFSAFHSMSAFCNAGFSTLEGGLSNPVLIGGNQLIYLVISALIIAGGIGFPILVNAKEAISKRLSQLWRRYVSHRPVSLTPHLYDLNSRVVLLTTSIIFSLSALLFFILEYNNSLAGMSPYSKIVQSIFNAVTPRSAGFSSVSPSDFMPATLLIVMLLMWIGGGSQSTAGGIKVNTFAAALLHLKATVYGRRDVVVFNRTISAASLSRAQAIIVLSAISYVLLSVALVLIEPNLPVRALLFESLSALFTVGSSMGLTPLLSTGGKLLIAAAMFVGRVGLLSLLIGFAGVRHDRSPVLPSDNLIIN